MFKSGYFSPFLLFPVCNSRSGMCSYPGYSPMVGIFLTFLNISVPKCNSRCFRAFLTVLGGFARYLPDYIGVGTVPNSGNQPNNSYYCPKPASYPGYIPRVGRFLSER